MLQATAKFWLSTKTKVEISDPVHRAPVGRTCDDETVVIPEPGVIRSPQIDPHQGQIVIEKKAHRMLRIRKRKMKVHRRKRRWKRLW